jgi:hypothetical protein
VLHEERWPYRIHRKSLRHMCGIQAAPALLRHKARSVKEAGRVYDKPDLALRRSMLSRLMD